MNMPFKIVKIDALPRSKSIAGGRVFGATLNRRAKRIAEPS
ncbi:MAG: hypothetical protein ACR2QR_06405 [Woeseiaceae bacterium]